MTTIDGTEIVAKHWPTIGPHTEESLASAAAAIQELFRYMAHATIGTEPSALPYACDGYTVVGRLAHAAHCQEQLLRQLAAWADALTVDPALRHDAGTDASITAMEASLGLSEAAAKAGELRRSLDHAQAGLSHLYHDIDDE